MNGFKRSNRILTFSVLIITVIFLVLPKRVSAVCTCDASEESHDKAKALRYKIAALLSILVASAIGVCIPLLGRIIPALSPEKSVFFIIKAFAAGVILATGFIHVLPDAFDSLTSPCLSDHPWAEFPFTGFVAMCSSMGTLMVDAYATAFFRRSHLKRASSQVAQVEEAMDEGHLHIHSHGTHGSVVSDESSEQLRHRVISQVLELGIVVHSVIIGISLGASMSPKTIRPLFAALTFHQFFEGMGLGSCITQAKFKKASIAIMGLFFALTTPIGIAIGIGISNVYNDNSPKALIVEGVFNAASAGILIYMALVDLLAADFMNTRMQNNGWLLLGANLSLLVGAGCMSILAKWA